jgi:chemotaxis protein MotB
MRRRPDEEHFTRERWLVSYADFITLLFAFFVVMYAISTLNEGKYRVISDAITATFRHERVVSPPPGGFVPLTRIPLPLPRAPARPGPNLRQEQEQKLRGLASKIVEAMNPLVQSGQVQLRETARGLAVEINASVLFAPAQATLQPDSISALQSVVDVLKSVENAIEVEGHTDKHPIATPQYPSNWELASARASAVIRLFIADGLPPERLVAVGYADNRPVMPGESAEALARNRRVTLLILSDAASPGPSTPEPVPPR